MVTFTLPVEGQTDLMTLSHVFTRNLTLGEGDLVVVTGAAGGVGTYMVQTAAMLLEEARRIMEELDIRLEFINIGGGLGIPYRPDAEPLNFDAMAAEITALFQAFKARNGYMPRLYMESGRYMTGPHGVLVTTAINRKEIYRTYVGVDASMSALMRPGMYGAYHHITVLG